jgi:hypothetical protein
MCPASVQILLLRKCQAAFPANIEPADRLCLRRDRNRETNNRENGTQVTYHLPHHRLKSSDPETRKPRRRHDAFQIARVGFRRAHHGPDRNQSSPDREGVVLIIVNRMPVA